MSKAPHHPKRPSSKIGQVGSDLHETKPSSRIQVKEEVLDRLWAEAFLADVRLELVLRVRAELLKA